MATKSNFYTNPAFCQQSEYPANYPPRVLSPNNVRQSPVGAQCVPQHHDQAGKLKLVEEQLEEQEFYEEVLVDDKGFITDKKFVVVAQTNEGKKFIQSPQPEERQGTRYAFPACEDRKGARYGTPTPTKPKITRSQSQRYEYIQLQEQNKSPKKPQYLEDVEVSPGRIHRYAVIEAEEETELTTRYALVPVDQLNSIKPNRYEYIQTSPSRYESVNQNRYEYIQSTPQKPSNYQPNRSGVPGVPGNPIATQKLHEILSTPKKNFQKVQKPPPKAQQKLNYALGAKQMAQDKRHMAIVAPICSSPIQSIYSETTFSKSGSWSNLSSKKAPTLTLAALIMLLCGAVTSGLCFYMIYLMERQYYLDFGVIAGFTCLVLGLLGFRSRNVYWLPNRNYITGYIILSIFSLSTCVALLVLLVKNPKKGTPLADMTSGAVCGFSVLSLILATLGVFSSYCCKYPPPDNRVQHCAQGFRV